MSEERVSSAFTEEGTLLQVEYALEASKKGMSCVVLYGKEGIAMAAAKRVPEKLMDANYLSSFVEILPGLVAITTGYQMDVQETVMRLKKDAVDFAYDLGRDPTPDLVCRRMADRWQRKTQESHMRLPGVALAVVGYEKGQPLIYYTDCSGTLLPCKGMAFGEGGSAMQKQLEKIYKPESTNDEILEQALDALSKALGADYLATNVELALLAKDKKLERMETDKIDSLLVLIAEKE
ncbi:20S proteasome subunit alpha 1 [Nematocida homosporus]|uniref:20S proteasome subunit alpha 1 n=1 Tax=Nematocida homosporus TaxID=1912981 RepID=UPI002220E8DA|nr:20S proteasome subunit alpha 1 [Nematocida homosporus]KAI5185067.1 20S proteasome subunit alpha 1 [Nematocida homosporus]